MITKKGPPRTKPNPGGIKDLAHYVADKAENARITNCGIVEGGAPDLELAIAEINATMALNTTATSDKIYHLIVSFRAGENPSAECLEDIERNMCAKLGLEDHQRLSGVHRDTDNLHLHIAINLVHPDTGRIIIPYQDYVKRSECCRELEYKWNLERDNGLHYITPEGEIKRDPTRKRNALAPTEKAKLLEQHRGIESFQGWVGKEPANALRAALKNPGCTWQDIHDELDRHNLTLVKKGNGYAVVDKDNPKLAAKASQVGRFFSKTELEKRLGEFKEREPQRQSSDVGKTRYVERPTHAANVERRDKQNALYKEYQTTKGDARRLAWQQQRESEKARFAHVTDQARAKREAIHDGPGSAAEKRAAYKLSAMERVIQEQALRQTIARERTELREQYGRGESFRQFVTRRAQEGDEAALAALRGMRPESSSTAQDAERRDALRHARPGDPPDVIHRAPSYNGKTVAHRVHRNGDVSYTLAGREALRDEGRVIRVAASQDKDTVELGLRLAQKKFGKEITLTGSDDFKRLAVETAVERGIAVKFTDPTWEAYRHSLELQRQAAQEAAARRPEKKAAADERKSPERGALPAAPSSATPAILVAHGAAKYLHDEENTMSYYATTRDAEGRETTVWGVDLERAITESGAGKGDAVHIVNEGSKTVTVNVPVRDASGTVIGFEEKEAQRNTWSVQVVGAEQAHEQPERKAPSVPPAGSLPAPAAPVEKVAFAVPYAEKNEARELGLRWDKERKAYTAERGSQAAQDAAARWPEKKAEVEERKPIERETPATPTVTPPMPAASDGEKATPTTWEQYLAERNATAAKVKDLPPHRLAREGEVIDGKKAGTATLASGEKAVKIEREERLADGRKQKEIVVVPMSPEAEKQLAKVKVGSRIKGTQREREFEIDRVTLSKSRGMTR